MNVISEKEADFNISKILKYLSYPKIYQHAQEKKRLLTNANIQTTLNNSNCIIFVYIVCALHLIIDYNLMKAHRIHFLWSYYAVGEKIFALLMT